MYKVNLLFSPLWIIAATALSATDADNAVLALSQQKQLEFRQGDLAVAAPLVKSLEDAVAKSPDNAKLWEALGNARMSLQGSLFAGQPDFSKVIEIGEGAREAYARSLTLNTNNPLVRSSHGMAALVVAQFKGDGPGMAGGIEEMNAAVRDAPKSTAVRLTRGFTMIHLPPAMRDTRAVIEDLQFIIDAAPGGRPEDVLHVLLGDVYAEMGDLEAARAEYALVDGSSAFAAEQVKLRFDDLRKGAVRPESIGAVRSGTGARCAMCHAPGTDK